MLAEFVIAPSLSGWGGLSILAGRLQALGEAILRNIITIENDIQEVVLEAGSVCGFDMRLRNPGRGRAILERCMNLGIVVNHEPESEIKWEKRVARVYVWRREKVRS
jgi:hypothetical protein